MLKITQESVSELAKSEEITDIWVYKNELMNSINAIYIYKAAFRV